MNGKVPLVESYQTMEDNMEFTELDLVVVGKIQELKSTTVAKAKEIFRKQVLKMANPDVDGRAELVLEAIERGAAGNTHAASAGNCR